MAKNHLDELNSLEVMDLYELDLIKKDPSLVTWIDLMLAQFTKIDPELVKERVVFPILYLIDLPSENEMSEQIDQLPVHHKSDEMAVAYTDYQMGGHPNINALMSQVSTCIEDDEDRIEFLRKFFVILYAIYRCKKNR